MSGGLFWSRTSFAISSPNCDIPVFAPVSTKTSFVSEELAIDEMSSSRRLGGTAVVGSISYYKAPYCNVADADGEWSVTAFVLG